MKYVSRLLVLAAILAGAWLTAGCASTEGESLPTKAGFDAVRADTTAQIDALKKLPPDRIYVVHRNGKSFYVFTDPPGGLIFVGSEADFARYRRLRSSQGEAEAPLSEGQSGLILSAWEGWKGWDA